MAWAFYMVLILNLSLDQALRRDKVESGYHKSISFDVLLLALTEIDITSRFGLRGPFGRWSVCVCGLRFVGFWFPPRWERGREGGKGEGGKSEHAFIAKAMRA